MGHSVLALAACFAVSFPAMLKVAAQSLTFPEISGYSTRTYNASAAQTYLPNDCFSDECLQFLWFQVGPVEVGHITTTVSPTPEPTAFARPGRFHPMVPSYAENFSDAKLLDGFMWGTSSAAFQVEGAAKDEGKGPTIWDLMPHRQPGTTADNTTGDVTSNHYYLYKQDIARLRALGIPYESFSLSWARIFPFGKGPVNAQGIAHYDDVIAEHVKQNVKPIVTLFHWDTPLALFNEYGAWSNEHIIDDYVNYAKFVIQRWDEWVPVWYTFNEPQHCEFQYSNFPSGIYYPSYNNISRGPAAQFACGHHLLLAHARVAKWYHNEFHGRGRITFKNNANYFTANSTSPNDALGVQRQYDFTIGWFGGPWASDGDYPESLKSTLGDILPAFTAEEKELIKGSCDFYAVDPYSSFFVAGAPEGVEACAADDGHPLWPICAKKGFSDPYGFPVGPSADPGSADWLQTAPEGMRALLRYITKELYPIIPDIVIAEFGFVEPGEGDLTDLSQVLWDLRRCDYLQSYLDEVVLAREVDGVNVTGTFAWAVFDNIEWFSGLRTRFGLQFVDFKDPELRRVPKASLFQFTDFFGLHGGAKV